MSDEEKLARRKRDSARFKYRYHNEPGLKEKTIARFLNWQRTRERLHPELRVKRLERMRVYGKTYIYKGHKGQ